MEPILEKSFERSRSLLFGLLQFCLLEGDALDTCPLEQLRKTLSFEEKYRYAMGLSDEDINKVLEKHEECFNKRTKYLLQK